MQKTLNQFFKNNDLTNNISQVCSADLLDRCQEMIDKVCSTNGSNAKVEYLSEFNDLKDLLKLVYNPLLPFHVTSKNCKKLANKKLKDKPVQYHDILELLQALSSHEISGHQAISSVLEFIRKHPNHSELTYKIIYKDLKIRMGVKQINKAFPDLIPVFSVALADKVEKHPKATNDGDWKISRKLDGARCIAIVKNDGDVIFFSRTGNEFTTLSKLIAPLRRFKNTFSNSEGCIFDGEVCIIDKEGKEDFSGIMKELKKKDYTMENPRYKIFDFLTMEEFFNGTSERNFVERYKCLIDTIGKEKDSNYLSIVEQVDYNSQNFDRMMEEARNNGWEGLMLRKNTIYKGKRSSDILKVKDMEREEYKVEGILVGPFQMINKDTKLQETIETLTAVTILHKGNPVSVGSGFTIDQRKKFYKKPNLIVGKIISVQYFEETTNDDGTVSLRFPIFKGLYGKTRDF